MSVRGISPSGRKTRRTASSISARPTVSSPSPASAKSIPVTYGPQNAPTHICPRRPSFTLIASNCFPSTSSSEPSVHSGTNPPQAARSFRGVRRIGRADKSDTT